ncbi:TPA: hypothetical protein ITR69_000059 [Enterococcus faecalis]|uniref:hypothetical protein n=1 Tax=Enterococcus TaxID=1350 RepID=UPI0029755EE8|nr:hypothetical protein [Enterococcus faecalis]HAP2781579.1 hypothetical protein [Enterococcus faecalis]
MILELLFNLLFGVIDFILNLIPSFDIQIDLGWISGLSVVFQYINMFVDVGVLGIIISIVVIRDNFVFLKNIFMAIVRKIPFIG